MPARDRTPRSAVLLAAWLIVVAACGSDDAADTADPASTTTTTLAPVPDESAMYDDLGLWHCHPDLAEDVCSGGFEATRVDPDGSLHTVPFTPVADPAIDCFYVYPTVDYSGTPGNRPFDEPNPLEPITIRFQVGRFGELCDLYVPRYRQATIASYDEAVGDSLFDVPAFATAYADVLGAFNHYLAEENDGRPFVLLGHSQGTHHLVRLVQEEIDGDQALRSQLVSALLVGPAGNVTVPEGESVGGTFDNLPLCEARVQTGCVVAFDSYGADRPPEADAYDPADGEVPPCVNPADLSGGEARLAGGYFGRTVPGVTTLYELIEDYYTAACAESAEGVPYLAVAADPGPGDTRELSHIETTVADSESLHTLDYNFMLSDLLALVQAQAAAFAG